MRTFLLAVSATLALAAPAAAATRNFGIESYTKIRVEGPFRVTVATGVPPFAKASGSPAALDRVAIDVEGDTLVVHSQESWGGYPGTDPGPVDINVGTHDLTSAKLTGAGSVAIDRVKAQTFGLFLQGSGAAMIGDAAIDQLSVNVVGSASAKIAGKAGKLTALVRGVSSLDAAALSTPNALISADGTATVDATVTDTAQVNAWGPTTIRFAGRPTCTVKVTGSATISGCR
ncbi:MAG TPA: head GIN domain-containing protein [Sphingomicrobium sp.]|jgi:hypothetical protein